MLGDCLFAREVCCCWCAGLSGKQQILLSFCRCGLYFVLCFLLCFMMKQIHVVRATLNLLEAEWTASKMIMETPKEVWVHALYSRTYERVRLCVHAYTNLPNQHTLCCGACIFHSAAGGSMFLSLRWDCSMWKMLSCCSGWSINSCCSNLLGFGPLQCNN